jgi:hypothetical protein
MVQLPLRIAENATALPLLDRAQMNSNPVSNVRWRSILTYAVQHLVEEHAVDAAPHAAQLERRCVPELGDGEVAGAVKPLLHAFAGPERGPGGGFIRLPAVSLLALVGRRRIVQKPRDQAPHPRNLKFRRRGLHSGLSSRGGPRGVFADVGSRSRRDGSRVRS